MTCGEVIMPARGGQAGTLAKRTANTSSAGGWDLYGVTRWAFCRPGRISMAGAHPRVYGQRGVNGHPGFPGDLRRCRGKPRVAHANRYKQTATAAMMPARSAVSAPARVCRMRLTCTAPKYTART